MGIYDDLINEANSLISTFTISYNFGDYGKDLFSSTYDEISGWIKKALKQVEMKEEKGKDSEKYQVLRKFRGRTGDVTLQQMKSLINMLSIG